MIAPVDVRPPGEMPATPEVRHLFGLPVHAATMEQAVGWCLASVDARSRSVVGVVNVAKVITLRDQPALRSALLDCDLVLADGQGVVWASRHLRAPLPERVAGIDLFLALLDRAEARGDRVYFLGARQAVLDRMLDVVRSRWPRLRVVGARNGYFSDEEAPAVAGAIAAAAPDMLFVGMTSPKKELFLRRYGGRAASGICHGVGGSFDVLAGVTPRAPVGWQRLGLEWLYRVLQEPRRLWRRYLATNTRFALLLLRELVRPTPAYRPDA